MLFELLQLFNKLDIEYDLTRYKIEEYQNGKPVYSIGIEDTPQEVFNFLDNCNIIEKRKNTYFNNGMFYKIIKNGDIFDITCWVKEEEEESEPDWDNLDWDDEEED
jgi:hypothetical protein